MLDTAPYRVAPGSTVNLDDIPARYTGDLPKEQAEHDFKKLRRRFSDLQELMYAEGKHALLVVLQAMDAAGKDSTVRRVFGPINPAGCRVWSFKAPNPVELGHDFLWRIHEHTPRKGYIAVFNRSHYEDILAVRVEKLAPAQVWEARYDHINTFEHMLHDEGTTIVKFFLHITKKYQRQRIERRLKRPDKHWKFDPADLEARGRWDKYRHAYNDALSRCSTAHAPWFVIPAETRWFRNLLVTRVLVDTLEALDMQYPKPDFDPDKVKLD